MKIRQDLLATNDVINLALHLRRFSELTNSRKRINGISLSVHLLHFEEEKAVPESKTIKLYDFVSRTIHSKTSAVCRNITHLLSHFDVKRIPRKLLDPPWDTKAAMVFDTEFKPKQFCFLREVVDSSNAYVISICEGDPETLAYLKRRPF